MTDEELISTLRGKQADLEVAAANNAVLNIKDLTKDLAEAFRLLAEIATRSLPAIALLEAHSENLIERMYVAEQTLVDGD